MVSFARSKARRDAAMSADFERELRREVLRTELLRVRALIVSGCIILLFEAGVNLFDPGVISRVWHGGVGVSYFYALVIGFLLFELWVHAAIRHSLKLDRDLPVSAAMSAR